MLMRRGSSQTGISGGSASPEMATSISPMGSPREAAVFASVPEPTYGEHSYVLQLRLRKLLLTSCNFPFSGLIPETKSDSPSN